MDHPNVSSCLEEWNVLEGEYQTLEGVHKQYQQKLEELHQYQERCLKGIAHQKYRAKLISKSMKHLTKTASDEDKTKMHKLEKEIIKRRVGLSDMEEFLPRKNGRYLRIILGSVNVSLMNRAERYTYKDEYEKFKMIVTAIGFIMSFLSLIVNYRFMDLSIIFLLVWYYCTLTIRESILKINGSKIKGWWRTHHFLSTVASGVLLIWPDSESYTQFRHQFLIFNCYIALVQFLQFRYQQGCLYRLKALGERHNMDITIEGFHSWMWRGLSFLLPFLFIGYFYQLYNAYTLYKLSQEPYCKEWQVIVLSVLFLALFMGNVITTSVIIPQKLKEKLILKYRFPRFMKRKNGQSSAQTRSVDDDKETPSSQSEPKKEN